MYIKMISNGIIMGLIEKEYQNAIEWYNNGIKHEHGIIMVLNMNMVL